MKFLGVLAIFFAIIGLLWAPNNSFSEHKYTAPFAVFNLLNFGKVEIFYQSTKIERDLKFILKTQNIDFESENFFATQSLLLKQVHFLPASLHIYSSALRPENSVEIRVYFSEDVQKKMELTPGEVQVFRKLRFSNDIEEYEYYSKLKQSRWSGDPSTLVFQLSPGSFYQREKVIGNFKAIIVFAKVNLSGKKGVDLFHNSESHDIARKALRQDRMGEMGGGDAVRTVVPITSRSRHES